MRLAILFFLSAVSGYGATYYVATNGNDSTGNGSSGTPWLTIQHGLDSVAAGDTLLVQPGAYYHSSSVQASGAWGTAANPITLKANGVVLWQHLGLFLNRSNYIVDGFIFDAIAGNARVFSHINLSTNAHNSRIINNVMQNGSKDVNGVWMMTLDQGGSSAYSRPWMSAANCVISNNVVSNLYNGQAFYICGSNTLAVNNIVRDSRNCDMFLMHGVSNIVRGNFCSNCIWVAESGNLHPDIMQTYGRAQANYNYIDAYGALFENNQFWDMKIALFQLEVDIDSVEDPQLIMGDWTIRNNLYVRCGPTNGSVSSIDIPACRNINNTYIQCGTWPDSSGGVLNFSYHTNAVDSYGAATNSQVMNCAFIGCGQNASSGWYAKFYDDGITPATNDLYADYNYVVNWNGAAWGTKTGFAEFHGLNTGADPELVGFDLGGFRSHYRPLSGSPLIDAGTNEAAYVVSDIEGVARPLGSAFDIGCFEFDPALKLHLDFDESFVADGYVLDVTGNGHSAYRMDATNWAQATPGISGTAWLGYTNGVMTNDFPNVYNKAQYAAITNVTGLAYITNGTILVWVQWATNAERWDTILDCGYAPVYSADSTTATNSWCLRYGSPSTSYDSTPTGPMFKIFSTGDNGSTNGMQYYWSGQTRDGATWHHLGITWSTATQKLVAYDAGVPMVTNDFSAPYLRISGSLNPQWLCLGAYQHDGTATWADDAYPNAGFFKGRMDDVRIYNRALSAAEVLSIYDGWAASPASSPGGAVSATVILNGQATFGAGTRIN